MYNAVARVDIEWNNTRFFVRRISITFLEDFVPVVFANGAGIAAIFHLKKITASIL